MVAQRTNTERNTEFKPTPLAEMDRHNFRLNIVGARGVHNSCRSPTKQIDLNESVQVAGEKELEQIERSRHRQSGQPRYLKQRTILRMFIAKPSHAPPIGVQRADDSRKTDTFWLQLTLRWAPTALNIPERLVRMERPGLGSAGCFDRDLFRRMSRHELIMFCHFADPEP